MQLEGPTAAGLMHSDTGGDGPVVAMNAFGSFFRPVPPCFRTDLVQPLDPSSFADHARRANVSGER